MAYAYAVERMSAEDRVRFDEELAMEPADLVARKRESTLDAVLTMGGEVG